MTNRYPNIVQRMSESSLHCIYPAKMMTLASESLLDVLIIKRRDLSMQVCMYVCRYLYMYSCTCICTYMQNVGLHMHAWQHAYMYTAQLHTHMYVCIYLCMYVSMFYRCIYFYGLAVKTVSIALQKLILFFLFFYLVLQKKNCFLGSNFFSPDSSQKTNATLYLYFFYIFTSFGVKNICALFREID